MSAATTEPTTTSDDPTFDIRAEAVRALRIALLEADDNEPAETVAWGLELLITGELVALKEWNAGIEDLKADIGDRFEAGADIIDLSERLRCDREDQASTRQRLAVLANALAELSRANFI